MKTRKDKIKSLAKEISRLKKEYKVAQQEYTFIMLDDEGMQKEYPWWEEELEFKSLINPIWDKVFSLLERLNKAKREFRKEHIIASLERGTPFEKIESDIKRTTYYGYGDKFNDKPLKSHQWMFWTGDIRDEIEHAIAQQVIYKIIKSEERYKILCQM